jgi:DNA-directed RNA polymerase subunit RPC12/RpoP
MAQNRIQFQAGMSMPEFIAHYGTEEQCSAALEQARWPEGFRCPRCGSAAHGVIRDDRAKRFQSKTCRHQTSLTGGRMMAATKGSAEQKGNLIAPRCRNRLRAPNGRPNRGFGLIVARFRAFYRVPRALRRPQDALTPCGGNNRLARTRLASANRLNNCAVFLANPR